MINTSFKVPTKSIPNTCPQEKEVVVMGCPIKMILRIKEITIYKPPIYKNGLSLLSHAFIRINFVCKYTTNK
jgi:hypothetical protein